MVSLKELKMIYYKADFNTVIKNTDTVLENKNTIAFTLKDFEYSLTPFFPKDTVQEIVKDSSLIPLVIKRPISFWGRF